MTSSTSILSSTSTPKSKPTLPLIPVSPPKNIICFSQDLSKHKDAQKFELPDMYTLINRTCEAGTDDQEVNAFTITDNGRFTLKITTSHSGIAFPWNREICIHGFTTAVDSCDKGTDLHYGGSCKIRTVTYQVSAKNTDTKVKHTMCYPKFKAKPFHRPDVQQWISDLCGGTNTFNQNFTRYGEPGFKKPLARFLGGAVEGKQIEGFDKAHCLKGFTAAVDNCNKGKDKDKEDLWGGECTMGDINFNVFPWPG
ncbi:MAG: hypothetical protein Q9209_007317 [Squamulea sp. 1 TL-2023]